MKNTRIIDRRFNREFQELERYEAGIVLNGAEVKSIRSGSMRLEEAFVKLIGSEAYLVNADIPVYKYSRPQNYDSRRSRKLLLHKKELIRLKVKLQSSKGLTVSPVSCYNKGSNFKLEIALVKSRGEIGKKNLEKKRDIARQQKREAKEYLKY